MNRLLYRYLAQEILVPFFLGLIAFNGILFVGRLLNLASLMVTSNIPLVTMLKLLLHLLPTFSLITIPMAFLLAVLLAFGRLSGDSEIIAMKAAGISLHQLLPPVLVLAALGTALTLVIALYVLPTSSRSFKTLLNGAIQHGASMAIREGVFNDRINGVVLYCTAFDSERNTMRGILIQDERNQREPLTIFASSGSLTPDPTGATLAVALHDGSIHSYKGTQDYRLVSFNRYTMQIPITRGKGPVHDEDDMTLGELLANLRARTGSSKQQRDMAIELHNRFAFPAACMIFAFIGMALGIQNQRTGKGSGFTLSVAVFVAYYIVLSIGKTMVQNGVLPPGIAMWLPNLLFLCLGITLFQLTARETRLTLPRIRLPLRRPPAKATNDADH
jgi:lipopolysaccharide export system permease protein